MMIAVRASIPVSDDRTRKADSRVKLAAEPTLFRRLWADHWLQYAHLHSPVIRLPYTPAAGLQTAQEESHGRTSPSSTICYTRR